MELTPDQKGGIAELAIALAAARLDIVVSRPMIEGARYDLVFDAGGPLKRVQCKWATRVGETVNINCRTSRATASGYIRSTYSAAQIDAIAAYCLELDECWLIPISRVAGRKSLHLRLTPARNNQVVGVTLAETYRLGAIAQLGERRHGMAEVGGSSPPGSIAREPSASGRLSSFKGA